MKCGNTWCDGQGDDVEMQEIERGNEVPACGECRKILIRGMQP